MRIRYRGVSVSLTEPKAAGGIKRCIADVMQAIDERLDKRVMPYEYNPLADVPDGTSYVPGGLVKGSMGMFGNYKAGDPVNPEVIAPLDRLRKAIEATTPRLPTLSKTMPKVDEPKPDSWLIKMLDSIDKMRQRYLNYDY